MPSTANPNMTDKNKRASEFWDAILGNDHSIVEELLKQDVTLVEKDFRPVGEQDPHTQWIPTGESL
ncbi:TPA: hypothetical protein EYN09_14465 [Candidatus Poribacteria bacterium]|jgi:hypothetical protein|nr:hypothetical protein [Candidatus Poribacteria bacterium]HIO08111.1 hypothetical protein [Candidatus Poribacteria bacterium]HIO50364.1 hypothetical protein [Candidatus Poribacteria bacterium]